ncbi:MAG: FtsQ-type POTRA domain-containing protein [Peptococcaceae bacterium]|nr:FtsQ-type POTRA domain-containing protein [Peptococcaceae bacterium]
MAKKISRYNLIQSIFFVIVFLTAAYVLARSSVFEVREIRVTGNNSLAGEKIVAVSGISPGENIFKLDLKASAEKIRVMPFIKSVELSRDLPSAVEIRVQERKPCALLPVDSGFIQVDDEGVYLQKGDIAVNQFPVVTGVKCTAPAPGEQVKSEALDKALMVIKELPPGLLPQLSEVNVDGDQAVAYTLDGIQCRLGTVADLQQKGEVFMKVLNELKIKGKKIEYIDLSYTGSPVVKYVE